MSRSTTTSIGASNSCCGFAGFDDGDGDACSDACAAVGVGASGTTNNNSTSATTSLNNHDDSCTSDSRIVIRRYNPMYDRDQVHSIFVSGMESLVPVLHGAILRSPHVRLALTTYWVTLLASWLLGSGRRGGTTTRSSTAVTNGSVSLPLLAVAASGTAVAAAAPVVGLYYYVLNNFRKGYIRSSIQSDLSDIENVYGGKGCFLVAEDTESKQIVGMVGGEHKKQQEKDYANGYDNGDDDGVYELRRMSVLSSCQKRGVGRRLIRALESELHQPTRLYLTCSSLQHSAHALYEKTGFVLKTEFRPNLSNILYRNAISFLMMEKRYKQ